MTPARILRAAAVLRIEAQCLRDSHTHADGARPDEREDADPCDISARMDHDEMIELAGELEAMARG